MVYKFDFALRPGSSLRQLTPSMQFYFINAIDCLALSCFLYLIVDLRDRRRRGGLPYPPGPPLRPIVGNFLDIPKDTPWSAYTDMSKKYGRRDFLGNTGRPI